MGGKIQVKSEKGKGSRFYFTIDAKIDQHGKPNVGRLESTHFVSISNGRHYSEHINRELNYFGLKKNKMIGM